MSSQCGSAGIWELSRLIDFPLFQLFYFHHACPLRHGLSAGCSLRIADERRTLLDLIHVPLA